MSKSYTLKADLRSRVGKGSSRELRRNGLVPAVIYGDKQEPLPISIPQKEVFQKILTGTFRTTLLTIDLDGKKINVLPKDYQLHPIYDTLVHVDFLRVNSESVVEVEVAIHFMNTDLAPGVRQGGVLNIITHTLPLLVPANAIPDAIDVDVKDLSIGDSIHLENLKLPENTQPVSNDANLTIVTLIGRSSDASEDSSEGENPTVS